MMNEFKEKLLVSVIIPTHNRAKLVQRAVESVLQQTYTNIEIIVISDGSTDGTNILMQKKEKSCDNLKFISYSPAKGANVARNIGIKAARGEIIAFLDDDDEWHKNKLQKQIDVFEKDEKIGLVCTAINSIEETSSKAVVYIPPATYDSSKEILLHNCIGSTTTVAIRREILNISGGFDENLPANQDYDLWIRICQITSIGVVKEPCVEYYNYASSGQISAVTEKYIYAYNYIENKYQDLFNKLTPKEQNIRLATVNISLAKKCVRNNDKRKAREYVKKAAKFGINTEMLFVWAASFFSYNFVNRVQGAIRKITGRNY